MATNHQTLGSNPNGIVMTQPEIVYHKRFVDPFGNVIICDIVSEYENQEFRYDPV